jgi:hypothetical protein
MLAGIDYPEAESPYVRIVFPEPTISLVIKIRDQY